MQLQFYHLSGRGVKCHTLSIFSICSTAFVPGIVTCTAVSVMTVLNHLADAQTISNKGLFCRISNSPDVLCRKGTKSCIISIAIL